MDFFVPGVIFAYTETESSLRNPVE